MANKTIASICLLILALNLISNSPAHANWLGKRGDQDDILGYLLKRTNEQSSDVLSAESAMMAIERIVKRWQTARKIGLAAATRK